VEIIKIRNIISITIITRTKIIININDRITMKILIK